MRVEGAEPGTGGGRPAAEWARWGRRVRGERALGIALAAGLVALALAYQIPRPLFVDIGGEYDAPYVAGFYAPEPGAVATLRWSPASSALLFRGLGRPAAPLVVRLQLSSGRARGTPRVPVTVAANGHPLPPLALAPASASYLVTVDPRLIGPSGDLRLDFAAPTFRPRGDPRDLAFQADFARIEFPGGFILPSLTQLAALLFSGALLYLLLRAVWVPGRWAGLLTGGFLLACAAIIAGQRLLLTVFTTRLAATLVLAGLLALLAEGATRRIARAAGWGGATSLPAWAWAGLRALIAFTVVVKVGGLLYPSAFIIDAYFHLKYVNYMREFFAGQRAWEQYFGKNLALAVMPKEEWGDARAFIPYSPFFYVVAAPLGWLPLPLTLTVPVFSGVLDALKVPLVFLIGLALGGARPGAAGRTGAARIALAGAAVFTVIPATFLIQQWGNWPTLLSLWLVTLWVALTTLFWTRSTRPPVWILSTAVLTLTFLSYTVTLVYAGIFGGLAVVAGWLLAPAERRRWAALALSLAVAAALSVAIYYGHYVGILIAQTLPTFGAAVGQQGKLTTLRPTWGSFLVDHLGSALQSYDLALIYALALVGAGLLFWRRARLPLPWQRVWLGAWLVTFPLFTLADYWVDQALKEFWFALPAVALAAAAWLLALQARGGLARLFAGLLGTVLLWQSVSLWVFRLLFHNR